MKKLRSTISLWLISLIVSGSAWCQEKSINEKLQGFDVPQLSFNETPLYAAVNFLEKLSIEFDVHESNPRKKGITIELSGFSKEAKEMPLNLVVYDLPIKDALRYGALLCGGELKITNSGVLISKLEGNKINERIDAFRAVENTKNQLVKCTVTADISGLTISQALALVQEKTRIEGKNVFAYNLGELASDQTLIEQQITKAPLGVAIEQISAAVNMTYDVTPEGLVFGWSDHGATGCFFPVSRRIAKTTKAPALSFDKTPLRDVVRFIGEKSPEWNLDQDNAVFRKGLNVVFDCR